MSAWKVGCTVAVLAIVMLELVTVMRALRLTWDCRAAARETWSHWLGRSSGHELCAVERLAHQEMSEVCVRRLRSLCALFRFVLTCFLCFYLAATVHAAGSNDSASGVVATGTFWAVCFCVHRWPGLVSRKNSDSFYVAFMVGQGVVACTFPNIAVMVQASCIQSLFTLLMSACCCRLRVAVSSTIGLMVARVVTVALRFPAGPTEASQVSPFLLWELVGTALLLGCVIVFRMRELDFLRSYFGEKALRQSNTAMTRLLGLICDATVELNSELQIVRAAPKFTAMLLLDTHPSVQGRFLGDFMPDEDDRSRFESLALSSLRDLSGAMPAAMYATLRGPGTRLPVEMLCVQFQSLEGTSHLFVGVREVPDQPVTERQSVGCTREPDPDAPEPAQVSRSLPRVPEGGLPSPHRIHAGSASPPVSADGSAAGDCPRCAFASAIACGGAPLRAAYPPRRRGTPSRPPAMVVGARAPLRLAAPALLETSHSAQELSLVQTLLSWNVRIAPVSCCLYHAYLDDARARLTEMFGQSCVADFQPVTEAQCQECGLLCEGWGDEEGEDIGNVECAVCAAPMVRTAPTPTSAAHIMRL